jgi:hypothetical protein
MPAAFSNAGSIGSHCMTFLSLSHNFTSSNPLTRLQPALNLKPRARRQRRPAVAMAPFNREGRAELG